jgi:hypothetical protein
MLYVEPFPPTGEKHLITDSGGNPLWSRDGKQLFFMRGGRQILSADIQSQPSFLAGKITALPINGIVNPGPRPYDITPDGKYFVVMFPAAQPESSKAPPEQINVTLNWLEELKQRVPVK